MQPTKSREHAPEVLSYRQRLYDRETLMMPNEPWNPAQRLAQMRDNYDKLVAELGVSPRGPKHRGASIPPPTGEDTKLPRVPQSRTWTQPGGRTSPSKGSQSARGPGRPVGYGTKAKGSSSSGPVQTARLMTKLDAMADAGQLSAVQAKRLRKLWALQEQMIATVGQGGADEEQMLKSFQTMLQYLEEPDATVVPSLEPHPPTEPPPAPPPEPAAEEEPQYDEPATSSSAPVAPPPPPPKPTAPPPDPEADAAFAKVDGFLAHSHTKVFELFRRMDSDLDGQISATEMFKGFAASNFKFDMSEDEVKAFIRKVEPNGNGTTSLKSIAKALRPGQSMKSLLKKDAAEMAKEADMPISPGDMVSETHKQEAQQHAGSLPFPCPSHPLSHLLTSSSSSTGH